MEIIQWHNTKSKPVKNYEEIRAIAEEMLVFIQNGKFKGYYDKAYAIHHSQVSTDPYNFFVMNQKENTKYKFFESDIIINPHTIGGGKPIRTGEACMSFPYRKEKYVERDSIIDVQYQIPVCKFGIGPYRLKNTRAKLDDLIAQIFQHECDHSLGRNIHYKD